MNNNFLLLPNLILSSQMDGCMSYKIFIRLIFALVLTTISSSGTFGQENLIDGFKPADGPNSTVFSRVGNGIRIKTPDTTPPKPLLKRNQTFWTNNSVFSLSGNFEVFADFDIKQIGPKEGPAPNESNVELAVQDMNPSSTYGINLNVDAKGKAFKVLRMEPSNKGPHYNIFSFPRISDKGKMGIRREGSEIVFLASENPDEAPKELVRLPYDSQTEPKLRITGFQGNGPVPMPLDVLLSDIAIKSDRILKEKDPKTPRPTPTTRENFPIHLDYAKKPERMLADLKKSNDSHQVFKLEGNGIRVKPPVITPNTGENYPGYWFRDSVYNLDGDFEISLHFDVNKLVPATMGGYGSVSFSIGLETDGPMGSISFGRGASRTDGQRISITRYNPSSAGRHWDTQVFKYAPTKGRLCLRKTGGQLFFLAEGEGNPEMEFFQCPAITSAPVRFRISADQGGTNGGELDLVVSDLSVSGNNITENGKPVKSIRGSTSGIPTLDQAPETLPPTSPRFWLYLVLGMGILSALGVAGFLIWRNKPRNQTVVVPPHKNPAATKKAAHNNPPPPSVPEKKPK